MDDSPQECGLFACGNTAAGQGRRGGGPHSFVSRWWAWPLPPTGPLEFLCEWPAFGITESRAGINAQIILDAARAASGYGQKTKADGGSLPLAWSLSSPNCGPGSSDYDRPKVPGR